MGKVQPKMFDAEERDDDMIESGTVGLNSDSKTLSPTSYLFLRS